MTTYRLLLLVKLTGVALYAGGLVAAAVSSSLADRRRAVHAIASPAMVAIWIAGYLLSRWLFMPLSSLWIAGGIGLSVVSLLALIAGVARERRNRAALATAVAAYSAALVLMVFRPSW